MTRSMMRTLAGVVAVATALTGLVACGGSKGKASSAPVTLRLGYFPNLTHATPIVGLKKNFFAEKLGGKVTLDTKTFNAGPEAVEALFSGAVDATYIGPNPTVNAWQKSKGKAVKVVAGAASGGAAFVVKPDITGPDQLKGKKIASPQLGNTQDVALRYWLKQHGLNTTKEGGGDVTILPQANADTVTAFGAGAIDGAWVPEPFASRLVKAGGKVLVDERDLWPGGKFVVTNLLVSTKFLKAHPDVVKNLIAGQVAANDFINANPTEAQQVVNSALGELSGKAPDPKQTADAWKTLTFLNDPIASSLRNGAKHAEEVGLLEPVDLKGIYDLTLLNEVLKASGAPEVTS
ncbi:ABC transporter substrate-binding protein [Planosporangium sp. 12N6]|uniref:ABC transporter substrate-binding protein n=1 Tax=Planosporangium spinosum TaxID=3402278 RepID=UPI003CFA37F4